MTYIIMRHWRVKGACCHNPIDTLFVHYPFYQSGDHNTELSGYRTSLNRVQCKIMAAEKYGKFIFSDCQQDRLSHNKNWGCWSNAKSMLGNRLRRWPNIEPALLQHLVFYLFGTLITGTTCPMLTQHWATSGKSDPQLLGTSIFHV